MIDVTLYIAFLAGLVSFLSPCLLPIVPGFLAYISGTSLSGEIGAKQKWKIFLNSVFFVLGFSVVFAALGVLLNTLLESVAYDALTWLSRIGGILVIFFGLYLTGLIKIPFLEKEFKIGVKRKFHSTYITSFVFGAAFAAGWTPCVGAVLGAILGIAATHPGAAFNLLLSYSIGLGLPFLVLGAFASQATGVIAKLSKYLKPINIAFGFLLIALGILIFTQKLSTIANFDFVNKILLQ